MLHSLIARAYLMVMDHHISQAEAARWVTHRLPVTLQHYYRVRIMGGLAVENV